MVIDPYPEHADLRFRTIFSRCVPGRERWIHRTACAHSADGIHWVPYSERPQFGSSGAQLGDVSCLRYDEDAREFVQNTRHGAMGTVPLPPGTPRTCGWFSPYYPHRPDLQNKRRVYLTRSHDFLHWSEPVRIVGPDDECDNLDEAMYGMGQFRHGPVHMGLLGIFRFVDGEMDVRLMLSRDGLRWRSADRGTPFASPRGEGYWDAHLVSMTSPPIEMGNEWWFYHGGASCHHDWWMAPSERIDAPEARDPASHVKFGLGLATMRKGGVASLYAAPQREGYLVTRPLLSDGDRVLLNATCGTGGYVRVEVTDPAGNALDGCELTACAPFDSDAIEYEVLWNASPQVPASEGGYRCLRFFLRNAHLYGFRFAAGTPS